MVEHMKIGVREGDDGPTVALAGELDLASAPVLREAAEPPIDEGRPIVIDLRELTFIDSTGLGAIAGLERRARDAGARFSLVEGPPNVQRVFEVSGTLDMFDWVAPPQP